MDSGGRKRRYASTLGIILLCFVDHLRHEGAQGDSEGFPVAPLYTGIITQLQEAEFEYQGQARSERDLETCISDGPGNVAICSIVQLRFWQPPLVTRLCRCPDRQECPWRWSPPFNTVNETITTMIDQDIDGELPGTIKNTIHTRDRTMSLNNRSQLKFCQNVRRMPSCSSKSTAIRIHSSSISENILPTSKTSSEPKLHLNHVPSIHATAKCKCSQSRYWKYQRSISNNYGNGTADINDYYSCVPLKRCKPMEFCGHISADDYSSYYQCSCPKGYLCLTPLPRIPFNISELLFAGNAYKGICTPTLG